MVRCASQSTHAKQHSKQHQNKHTQENAVASERVHERTQERYVRGVWACAAWGFVLLLASDSALRCVQLSMRLPVRPRAF